MKLSFCMMVKNEEKNLGRCLESIKDLADEIIIVDTGSSDGTIKIAEEYGAKIYEHPWENDFSLHRNQSIGYATGDWVFIIDADNELVVDNKDAFLKFIKKMPLQYDTILLTSKDMQGGKNVMQFNTARVFRRNAIHYEGIVHNQPHTHGKAAQCDFVHLLHYGYDLSPEEKQKKKERLLELLYKRLENNPEDYSVYFYLAQCYAVNGDDDKCIEAGEEYIKHRESVTIRDTIFFTIARQYMKKNNIKKSKQWIDMGLEESPDDLDLNLALLEWGVWQKQADVIKSAANQYIKTYFSLMEDPSRKGKKFIFSLNENALAFCYYWLAALTLEEGVRTYSAFMNALLNAEDAFRERYKEDMEKIMKSIGITIENSTK